MEIHDTCFRAFANAFGDKDLNKDQVKQTFKRVKDRARRKIDAGSLDSIEDAIFQSTRDIAKEIKEYSLLRDRKTALNIIRRQQVRDSLRNFKDPVEGLKALMVGIQRGVAGARSSIDAAHKALSTKYLGGLLADLRRAGLLEVFLKRSMDQDIARELWEIKPNGRRGISKNNQAMELATIIHKWQITSLERMNRAGAYVRELQGYMTRQSHDFNKLSKAGFKTWFDFVLPRIDIHRTFADVEGDVVEAMESLYESLKKGTHHEIPEDELISLRGPDVAKKVSAHRTVHFRTADGWFEYNQKFGSKSLTEAVTSGLDMAARHTALLEAFGPEPEPMFKTILQETLNETKDDKTIKRIQDAISGRGMINNYFLEVTGKTELPARNLIAKVGKGIRWTNVMSKLGLITISALSDLPHKAATLHHHGIGFLEAYKVAIEDIFKGRGTGFRREFADLLGAGIEGTLGDVHGRFSTEEGMPGAMSRSMQLFFKANGMNWWNDSHKTGAVLMLSHHLGRNSGRTWGEIGEKLQRTLGLYGIDEKKWNVIRTLAEAGEDGRKYISPERIQGLGDDVIRAAYDQPGANDRAVRRLKDDLETRLRSYFTDQVDYAVLTPGAAERAYTRLGTQSGTALGEAIRVFFQFKQFPITVMTKGLGRALYGRGAETFTQALFRGKGDVLGLVHLMVASTAMGYLAMSQSSSH